MSTPGSCNVSADDDVCEVAGKLEKIKTSEDNEEQDDVPVCANCGKEGANNICNKCKQVRYCNAACKKKHRHKHKKQCEEHQRLAAEHAAELHDEELFKEPPSQYGDCPICFLRLPTLHTGWRYQTCCGKVICSGCSYAPVYDDQGNEVDNHKCPFCRTPAPTSEKEANERDKKRMEAGDPIAIYNIGRNYYSGLSGYTQDYKKALELWHQAGELGYANAYNNIGYCYNSGNGVEVDKGKAKQFYELAAMGGDSTARHNLGNNETRVGNYDRALKHSMIAVRGGDSDSLITIKGIYLNGYATKEDYTKGLQLYQEYMTDIKSNQRDKAAAAREDHRYY